MKKLLSTAFILIYFFAFVSEVFSTPPSVQSRYIAFSNITSNSASVQWTRGNGAGRIVVVHYGGTADWNDFLTNYLTPLDVSGNFSTLTDADGDLTAAYNDTDNRYQNSGNTYVVIDIVTGTGRTSNFTNLVSGTTYNVRIFEYNISGTNADFNTNSATNNPRSFTTYNVTPPSGLSISEWSEGGKLSWTTDGTNAAGYLLTIKQGGTPVPGYENLDIGKPSTQSYEIMGLAANTAYTYEIKSYDANNNLSNAATDGWTTLANPSLSDCPPTSYSPGHGTIVGIGGTVTINFTATNNQVGLVENNITTINGVNRTSFTDNGDGTYTVVYTVQSGNTDIADVNDLPLNIDLEDGNGVAFASACTGSGNATNAPGIDANAPTVTNVTSTSTDGSYGIGCNVNVQIVFNEPVTFTAGSGQVQLQLETGLVDQLATSNTDQSGTTIDLTYTVQQGDVSGDLDYTSTTALSLTGSATIKDAGGNNADLTLVLPGASGSLGANKNLVIDGVRPTVTSINRQSPSGSCTNVNTVTYRVTFSENIDNSSIATTDFTPVLVSGTGTPTVSTVTAVGTPPTNQYDIDVNVTSLTTAEVRLNFTGSVNDVVANCANASTATFTTGQTYEIDHAAPTASIGGTSGLCYTTAPTSVSGTASDVGCGGLSTNTQIELAIWVDNDNNGAFNTGDFYYNGADWTTATSEVPLPSTSFTAPNWSWNLPSPPNNDARYYVQVRATDGAGNTSAWSSQTGWYFVLDNIAPEVNNISDGGITCAKSGDVVTITFDWTELNLGSNPTVGIYQSDGTTLIGYATHSSISGTAPNYTYTYTYTVGTGDYQNVQIKVNGSDCAGNAAATGTLTNAFNIDNTLPIVSNISDGGVTCAKSGDVVTITFDWTELNLGSNPTVGIYQSDGTTLIGYATHSSISGTAPNYTYTYTYTVGTGDYQNVQIKVNGSDCAGNAAATGTLTNAFHIDNTAPVVGTINDGGATCVKQGDVVTITFPVTEQNTIPTNPTVNIYQSDGTTLIGSATFSGVSGTAPNYTYTYTYTVPTGDYQNVQIHVLSFNDCAGNTSTLQTLTNAFHIDNTAPVISNLADDKTCVKNGDVVTITFNITETNTLSANPTVTITDASDNVIGTAAFQSYSAPTYTYQFTVGTGNYQNCKIKVDATDCAGNAATQLVATNAFHIDNTLPVVNITSPLSNSYSNGSQVINRSITETNPTTDQARLRWPSGGTNTGAWQTYTPGTTQISSLPGWSSILDGETFDVEISHTDCAGNVSAIASATNITKDVTAPTITQFQMGCPPSTSGTITFSEPVYATNNGTGNLTGANISVTSSGGSATINTSNVSHTAGATTATVNITWTGTLNGFENVTVGSQSGTSVYDAAGNAMAYPHTASDYANVEITIVTNPTNQTVCENTTANFSGSATGGAGLQYVWQYSTDGGNNFTDLSNGGTNPTISGATTTNLQLQNVPSNWNNYLFRLKAYNECDDDYTTTATLTVTPPTSITAQPQNTSICVGATASLSVLAQGGSLSYQWQYEQSPGNWVNVSDGTPTGADYTPDNGQSSTLQISGLASGSYNYRVIVYGSCSPTQVTSNTATVTVNALPTATISGDQTICAGSNATLTITLTGQSPWTVDVNNYGTISNITSSPYNFNVSPSSTTTYTITSVTDGNNCTNTGSGSATVTIQAQPTANAGFVSVATCVSSSYTVNDASASNYSSIQWTHNGNGTLYNSNTLSPTYTPASGDAGNIVTLTLTAYAINPCTTPATSQKQLYIEPTPVAPTITKSPNVATVCEGTNVSATFSGGSGGNGQETYEYDYDNLGNWQTYTAGSNLTTTGYSVVKIRARREASYCSSSNWVEVTWNIEPTPVAPTITPSPNSPTVCQGTSVSATFSGGSGGSGTNTYEYRVHDCSNWSSWATYNPGDNISTVDRCTVQVRAIRNANTCSPAENTYTWVVNPSSLSVNCGSNSPVCEGGSLYLTASVSGGSGNYTYSWTGPNSFSSNDQNPTRSNMTTNDAGNYIVTVTDQNTGCVSSCTTAVTVLTNPSITTQPSDYKIVQGQSASPAFDPTTTNATSFQWYRDDDGTGYDGSAISGATSEDYSVNNAQFSQDGLYYLKASNNCDDVFSNYVRLKVAPTQASLGSANRTATTITLNWTRGNGDGVLLTVKQGTSNNDLPNDGTTYTASSNYNLAPEINGAGTAKIVYVGTGTSVTVTNLTNNTNYTFRAYEYKNASLGIVYNTNTSGSNPRTFKTLPKEIAEENTTIGDIFAISIQPNPVTDESFAVKLYTDEVGLATVEIINELGETILSRNVEANVGINVIPMTMPIDNTKKGAGVYYLRVSHNGESLVQKFIYLP